MRNLKGLVIVMVLISALSATTVQTFAASPASVPGNGFGDHNHHHTGPPGQSDRPGDHVKASFNIVVAAEGSVHAVLEVINGIISNIHFG